jgi:hypothetical protein
MASAKAGPLLLSQREAEMRVRQHPMMMANFKPAIYWLLAIGYSRSAG